MTGLLNSEPDVVDSAGKSRSLSGRSAGSEGEVAR